jgi:ATP-dependent helicase/nuclease subunit A
MNMTSSPTQPVTPSIADNEAAPDPNLMQRAASDPNASVWVNASAGTGKTKVLTDRLIRLMLPKPATEIYPERAGTAPHRILCLTYTKAGAGEMLNRIMEILSKWASLSEDGLRATLEHDVLGYTPLPSQIQKARSLFAEVVDTPGGIKIMTIHSFCQSLLGRFPVEANLPPDFSLMGDDETRRLT